MDVTYGPWETLRLGMKLVGHKLVQYRLATNEYRELNTTDGPVRGRKRRTIYDDEYYAYEGIPYAEPPVGTLRFRAPQPPKPWTEVRDCSYCRSKPLQENFVLKVVEGSEDCLYLNVYVKDVVSQQPLPVMVWLYGGGFQFGEASRDFYAPDYLMQQPIVLVTLNYRLGALGFLSLDDPDVGVPGNAGLKDQLMALRWVQANIARFGGDPNNVTLFGESAGAASVHLMLLADKAKGLCHKAIMQSGCALCPWVNAPRHNWPYRLAQALGYKDADNDKQIYRFLAAVDPKRLAAARLLTKEERIERVLFAFGPVVEPYASEEALFTRPFKELLSSAWSNHIPLLIGGTSYEGLFAYPGTVNYPYLLNELNDCLPVLPAEVKSANHSAEELREMALKIKRLHFGDKQPSVKDTLHEYMDLLSYRYFWHDLHRTLRARLTYSAGSHAPTYLYRFDFDSPHFNHFRMVNCGRSMRGVSHADDVSYLFYLIAATKLDKQSAEYKTIERMVGMWTAFAGNSNPNCAAIAPAKWEAVMPVPGPNTKSKCLNIGDQLEFMDLPEADKLKVWDSLYWKEPLL